MACRETTSTVIHGRHSRRCPHTSGRSPSIAPTSATANRETPALNVSLSQPTHSRQLCVRAERLIEADVLGRPGLGRAAARGCAWRARHQLRPSVVDARFSLVLQIPRSTPRRISVEARKIASVGIHCNRAAVKERGTNRTSSPNLGFCFALAKAEVLDAAPHARPPLPGLSLRAKAMWLVRGRLFSSFREMPQVSYGELRSRFKGGVPKLPA